MDFVLLWMQAGDVDSVWSPKLQPPFMNLKGKIESKLDRVKQKKAP